MNRWLTVLERRVGWEPWHDAGLCVTSPVKDLFTVDALTVDQEWELSSVCHQCPVFLQCRTRAETSPATSGYWAGRFYGGQ